MESKSISFNGARERKAGFVLHIPSILSCCFVAVVPALLPSAKGGCAEQEVFEIICTGLLLTVESGCKASHLHVLGASRGSQSDSGARFLKELRRH